MEQISDINTQAPVAAPVSRNRFSGMRTGIAWLGIVLVLALLAAAAYWVLGNRKVAPAFPADANVVTSLGYVPASTLFVLNEERTAFAQQGSVGEPEGTVVIDMLEANETTWYLILDPSSGATTLYRKDGDALVAVTTSATVKFDLSYDASTNTVWYLSKQLASPEEFLTIRDWNVTSLAADGTETVLGTGLHLVAVPGGAIVGTFDGKLSWIDSAGIPTLISERPQAWLFDVNAAKGEVAVFNATTHMIDRFDISGGARAATLVTSEAVASQPTSISYMGDRVIAASVSEDLKSIVFDLAGTKAQTVVPLPNPSVLSAAYNLSIGL